MGGEVIGAVGFLVLFFLLALGVPIAFGLALVGFGGFACMWGVGSALSALPGIVYGNASAYTLSVIPLFVLMGELTVAAGLVEGAYEAASVVMRRVRGGLAMGTILASAGFAACSGSSVANAAMMTRVAVPEMLRYGYSPRLATASVAAGGTLGILIPPSVPMIMYAVLTDTSVGQLFMGGVVPGVLLTFLFICVIGLWCQINPALAGASPESGGSLGHAVLRVLRGSWPVCLLALIILGGIWGGVFSPTEAGAVGCLAAFVAALTRRRLTKALIVQALRATTGTTAMIFAVLMGAMVFGAFITVTRLPNSMVAFLADVNLPRGSLLLVLVLVYILLGCVMDTLAITVITLPIVFPIVSHAGIDPVFFGILYTVTVEMALVTPPIGMNIFVIGGMIREVPMYDIFRGIVPFLGAMVVLVVVLILFPQVALWLPSVMIR